LDANTGEARVRIDQGGLDGSGPLFEILDGIAPLRSDEPDSAARPMREALLVGAQHTAFACVTGSRKSLVLIVAPNSFSVALGWSLLRRIADAAEGGA
jgi:hypothetical protein